MARITGIALTVAVSLLLAACGGQSDKTTSTAAGPTEAERVLAVAREYTAAFVDGEYARACALLTPTARARFTDAAEATGAASCAGVLEEIVGPVGAAERDGTGAVQAKIVSLAGDRARVRTTVEGQAETIALDRLGDRWRVDASL